MIKAYAAMCAAAALAAPAAAREQVWQTGDGYSVRAEGLDLFSAAGREKLLARVDWASARLCRDVRPARDRKTCADEVRKSALHAAPAEIRRALADALQARGPKRWAKRCAQNQYAPA